MSRQLLSELVVSHNKQTQEIQPSFSELDNNKQLKSKQYIIDTNNIQLKNRLSSQEIINFNESEQLEANNIKNFVNQSNKYWKQEREMFASSKKLSLSFQSENIDNSSCGGNSQNNQINNFNSNNQNEIKIGIQDIQLEENSNNQDNTPFTEMNLDYNNVDWGNKNQLNLNQYSFIDFQLNASQQEYMKTSNRKRINNSYHSNTNKDQKNTSNLENILSNIDNTEEIQRPSDFVQLGNINKIDNDMNSQKTKNTLNEIKAEKQKEEYQFAQRRSISIDSATPNTAQFKENHNYIAKQNQNKNYLQLEFASKSNFNSAECMSQDQFIKEIDTQSNFSQPIKDKTEYTGAINTQINNSLSLSDYNSKNGKKEVTPVNKSPNKYTALSINQQGNTSNAQFVFSYTNKQATSFPKQFKLNEYFLEVLELSNNKFKQLPEEIYQFKQLKRLKLDNNFIRQIPQMLFSLIFLQDFSISNNLISELPINISNQQSLVTLDISKNRITHLPEQICKLKQLQSLNISNNEFTSLPIQLKQLIDGNLRELILDWFKYCNPPLSIQQINTDNKVQLNKQSQETYQQIGIASYSNQIANHLKHGGDVISPLKKLSQLLFRQEQQLYYSNQFNQKQENVIKLSYYQVNKSLGNQYSFSQFVNEMSSNGFIINIRNFKGQNMMHLAAANEDIGVIDSLNQIDLTLKNHCDSNQHSPLSLSIYEEKYFSAKKLLQLNADPNVGGSIYGSPLNIATIKGQIYLIQDITSKKANLNLQDVDGNTSLHYIMTIFSRDISNSAKIAEILLEHGADPNIKNKDGWTPLHLAVRRSQYSAVNFAIDYNKLVQMKKNSENCQQQQQEYKSFSSYCKPPFKVGQNSENSNQIQNQIKNRNLQEFDFTMKGGVDKWSCLHISCYNNDVKMTKLLLALKEIDFFALNRKNQTPLFLSSKGNSLSKLMRLQLQKRIYSDLQVSFGNQKQQDQIKKADENQKDLQIKLITDGCSSPINAPFIIQSSEINTKNQQNNNDKYPLQIKHNQQLSNIGFSLQNNSIVKQSILPDHSSIGSILANITSPQEKQLPFQIQKKFVHKIQSKKAISYDLINFDEDDEDNNDICEISNQHDDFNLRELDENNQIKEIRKSKEGNITVMGKKYNQNKSVDNSCKNYSTINDFDNSPMALKITDRNSEQKKIQNYYSIQKRQKCPIPPYQSSNTNKHYDSKSNQSTNQIELFTQRICKVQQKQFVDEEQSEIQTSNSIQELSNQRISSNYYLGCNSQRDSINKVNINKGIYCSDSKNTPIKDNNFENLKNKINKTDIQQTNKSHNSQFENELFAKANQSINNLDFDSISLNAGQNIKISMKEQKKLSHNLLRYSHDDQEGNIFSIPKLYSGDNRQQIVFQTIQNIFSLFISGTVQYKKSLTETIQCLSDQYKQIVIILKLSIESYLRMQQFISENCNYLPQSFNNNQTSSLSLNHIRTHTALLLSDLLFSINTTPINFKTLMRFVEDKNEEFQENLILQRQSKDKSTCQTTRQNQPIPASQGDAASGSQSGQSSARSFRSNSQSQTFTQYYSQLVHQKNQNSKKSCLTQKTNSSISVISNNSSANQQKVKEENNSDDQSQINSCESNSNNSFLIKEYLISSLAKVDISPEFNYSNLEKLQKEDQNILIQYESFQTKAYFQTRKNLQDKSIELQNTPQNTQNQNTFQNTQQSSSERSRNTPIFKPPSYKKTTTAAATVSSSLNSGVNQVKIISHKELISQKLSQTTENNNKNQHNQVFTNQRTALNTSQQGSSINTSNYNNNNFYFDTTTSNKQNSNLSTINYSNQNHTSQQSQLISNASNKKNQNLSINSSNVNITLQTQVDTCSQRDSQPQKQNNTSTTTTTTIINANQIFQYQNKSQSSYNGYFNSQVLQDVSKDNKQIPQRLFLKQESSTKTNIQQNTFHQPKILNFNSSSQLSNPSENSVIKLITSESSETLNMNENLENQFLNDEAKITNKYLNNQINKLPKYK
ncbi:ankyrin repeat protein (macronuclear) [Tetrahymena thermophila SB210]|uniref:Ankyrin repeat protein n=1 Tax=Tetrahymena thermophila (strain SB210) TaxID=312017 RepID=Q22VZ0_TETTS|nr:ankyrin repeat protein [Tetrahymena thermophila SB210]EAR89626.2 ankyrin repeat protein [Tetrahymena thermophila SB210]|eukprot:XP_001009872.2 ankyrin repeat protein [Tetrahymena thermophila SB210]